MKYNININQFAIMKSGVSEIDLHDAAILDFIKSFMSSTSCKRERLEDMDYFWISHAKIIDDLPMLKLGKEAIYKRMSKLCDLGLLVKHPENIKKRRSYYAITPLFDAIHYAEATPDQNTGLGKLTPDADTGSPVPGYGVTPDQNTGDYNTIDNSTKNNKNNPSEGSPSVNDKEAKDQEKFRQYIELCNEHLAINGVKRSWRPIDGKAKSQFLARLRDGYTGRDFLNAMSSARKQQNHIDSGFKWLTPEFFTRNDKLQLYANMPISSQADKDDSGLLTDTKGVKYYLTSEGTRKYLEPVPGAEKVYNPGSNKTYYLIKDTDAKQ